MKLKSQKVIYYLNVCIHETYESKYFMMHNLRQTYHKCNRKRYLDHTKTLNIYRYQTKKRKIFFSREASKRGDINGLKQSLSDHLWKLSCLYVYFFTIEWMVIGIVNIYSFVKKKKQQLMLFKVEFFFHYLVNKQLSYMYFP